MEYPDKQPDDTWPRARSRDHSGDEHAVDGFPDGSLVEHVRGEKQRHFVSDPNQVDELVSLIATTLEVDGFYQQDFPADQTEAIALTRRAGREAGRALGWRVRTHARTSFRVPSTVIVLVDHHAGMSAEDEDRIATRYLARG